MAATAALVRALKLNHARDTSDLTAGTPMSSVVETPQAAGRQNLTIPLAPGTSRSLGMASVTTGKITTPCAVSGGW